MTSYAVCTPEDLERVEQTLHAAGYRLLKPDVDTIRTGDEGYDHMCNTWEPVVPGSGGVVRSNWGLYRRKLLMGGPYYDFDDRQLSRVADKLAVEGYELLRPGDVIQDGDEFLRRTSTLWESSTCVGSIITDHACITRRKLVIQPTDTPPTEGDRLMKFFFGCGG